MKSPVSIFVMAIIAGSICLVSPGDLFLCRECPFTAPEEIVNKEAKYGEIQLDMKEEILLRESESDPHYMFGRDIWDFVVDSKGNIYLLDDERILKFDDKGKFVASIGKRGQGPGEFMSPRKLFLD